MTKRLMLKIVRSVTTLSMALQIPRQREKHRIKALAVLVAQLSLLDLQLQQREGRSNLASRHQVLEQLRTSYSVREVLKPNK